jgi:hypothetical protein
VLNFHQKQFCTFSPETHLITQCSVSYTALCIFKTITTSKNTLLIVHVVVQSNGYTAMKCVTRLCKTRMVVTLIRRDRHWALFWVSSIQFTLFICFEKIHFNTIPFLVSVLSEEIFLFAFQTKILYVFFVSSTCAFHSISFILETSYVVFLGFNYLF